ncbi:MAG: hypothetical protein CVV47_04320 [Spirochaetae bacterium HGW-Spirochaetae-3]|nr:MAG: hypothetical protein CVV47_04320 [Spirochaetae bacterium HGW-Spirochaetae-3]
MAVASFCLVLDVTAQDSPNADAQISIESELFLAYTYADLIPPLGGIDSMRLSRPLSDFTATLESSSGVGVTITTRLVSEYRAPGEFNVPVGQSGNPVAIENNLLTAGILYAPALGGLLRIGRQKVDLGPSRLSGLQIDTHVPYLDALYYSLPLGKLEITQVIATLENRPGAADVGGLLDPAIEDYGFSISQILLSSRRFAFKLDNVELGLGVQSLFSRPNNAFQFGDILPIFSVHNGSVGSNNISFIFDAEFNATQDHRQYLVLGFDDFNANLFGVNDSGIPTIWAFQGGLSGTFHFGSVSLDYDTEVLATHYLWGSFDDDLALSRAIYRLRADGKPLVLPLSSPFGPGRLSFETVATVRIPEWLDVECSGLLLYGDPSINLTDVSYVARDVSYEFMLFRVGVTLTRDIGSGVSLSAGGGGDLLPDGFSPRLQLSGAWRFNGK